MVFFLSLFSCNFDDQLSQNFHRFVSLCICWDTLSEDSGLWQLPKVSSVFKRTTASFSQQADQLNSDKGFKISHPWKKLLHTRRPTHQSCNRCSFPLSVRLAPLPSSLLCPFLFPCVLYHFRHPPRNPTHNPSRPVLWVGGSRVQNCNPHWSCAAVGQSEDAGLAVLPYPKG